MFLQTFQLNIDLIFRGYLNLKMFYVVNFKLKNVISISLIMPTQ